MPKVDATLALVILVLAAEGDGTQQDGLRGDTNVGSRSARGAEFDAIVRPDWWEAAMLWTFQSCGAVLHYLSAPQNDNLVESGGDQWWSRRASNGTSYEFRHVVLLSGCA